MLITLKKTVLGSTISGVDGKVGTLHDVYFSGGLWSTRYLVANTGSWRSGGKALISPSTVQQTDWESRLIHVNLTMKQLEDSPAIEDDAPISRQLEEKLAKHFQWPVHWGMGVGGTPVPQPEPELAAGAVAVESEEQLINQQWPETRSIREVNGYRVEGTDGEIGYVEDFILDDESWSVRYMIANTGSWWPGKSVLVAPQWIESMRWSERTVRVALMQKDFQEAPAFDASVAVNRQYEEHLYDFHGRERYWK